MNSPTTVARPAGDEQTARRLAAYLGESLDGDDTVCAAFEDGAGGGRSPSIFANRPRRRSLRGLVAVAAGEAASRLLIIEPVAAADWVAQSLADLKPVRIGRFLVHGAHDRAKLRANDIGIEIEAALAFGTGHHGTTRGCLQAFAGLAKRRQVRRVLDVGTGSGIFRQLQRQDFFMPASRRAISMRAQSRRRAEMRASIAPRL